jgi:putative FmdB family regulatory protein
MPIHEYRCRACGARFEILVLPGRGPGVACDRCGSAGVERLPSRFSLSGAARPATGRDAGQGCCGGSCGCGGRRNE